MCKSEYKRICPKCKNVIYYASKTSLNHALKKNETLDNIENISDIENARNAKTIVPIDPQFVLHIMNLMTGKKLKQDELDKLIVNGYEQCSLSVQDSKYIPILCENLGIKNNKTTNPPDIKKLKTLEFEKLYSLIIGYIDGDGNIKKQYKRKDFQLSVKCHKSWIDILSLFSKTIDETNKAKINSCGYAEFHVTKTSNLKKLKKFAIKNNLPILERKWNNVDVNYVSKYDLAIERKNKIKKLCDNGKTIKEISNELNLKYTTVYSIINKNNFNITKNERKSNKKKGGILSEEKGN